MKTPILAGCAVLSALALSGCGTLGSGPSNLAPVIDSLAHAGCSGNLHFAIGAGSAAGLSPGSFHAENTFDGKCDPRDAPAVVVTGSPPAPAVPIQPAIPK
jgi:hypothetical protein